MFDPASFRALVSGQRQGVWPAMLRCALQVAELPYALEVARRNRQYDRGGLESTRVGVPVISVGNLTLGGTGKTPMVEWLARWFRQRSIRVGLISRGYGAEEGSRNDEALELEQKLPDVPHVQNPDRVAAARLAIEEFESQLLILDDAFQHRRIHRDLDLVLIDALEPFGFGHVFPRGLLREPLAGLARADMVALSRADMLEAAGRTAIRTQVEQYHPQVPWLELTHQPRELLQSDGTSNSPILLAGRRVAAFCGIGNPDGFRHTLAQLQCQVVAWREFPDHHNYDRDDVEQLRRWVAETGGIDHVACTHKDLVKLGLNELSGVPLHAVAVQLEISAGREQLEARLEPLLRQVAP